MQPMSSPKAARQSSDKRDTKRKGKSSIPSLYASTCDITAHEYHLPKELTRSPRRHHQELVLVSYRVPATTRSKHAFRYRCCVSGRKESYFRCDAGPGPPESIDEPHGPPPSMEACAHVFRKVNPRSIESFSSSSALWVTDTGKDSKSDQHRNINTQQRRNTTSQRILSKVLETGMTATSLSNLRDSLNLLVCLRVSAWTHRPDQRTLVAVEIFAPNACQTPSIRLAVHPSRRNTPVLYSMVAFET